MRLLVKVTRIVSTEDLDVTSDPPLVFEVTGNIGPAFFEDIKAWELAGYDLQKCAELMGRVFLSVTQDDNTYPLNSQAAALALYEAIEETNPGAGHQFMIRLLENFTKNHLLFFQKRRNGSSPSAPPSETGSTPAS